MSASAPSRAGHDDNIIGALAFALADRIGDATTDAAGVSGVPAAALAALHEWAGGRPIQKLAHGLRLSHSRTVRVIDRLEADGLALRRPDPADGRSVHVALTPAGDAVARRVLAARAEALHGALASLRPGDRAAFARLAEQVLEGFITGRRHAAATCRMCDAHACGHYDGRCPVTRGADRADEGAARSSAH
jgi:MarR family transcriptional repressor of emrRAB